MVCRWRQGPGCQRAVRRSPELLPVCKSPRWCRARPRSRGPGEAGTPGALGQPAFLGGRAEGRHPGPASSLQLPRLLRPGHRHLFLPTPRPTSRISSPSHRPPGAWSGFWGRERRDGVSEAAYPSRSQERASMEVAVPTASLPLPPPGPCRVLWLPQVLPVLRCSRDRVALTCGYSALGQSPPGINRVNIAIGSGPQEKVLFRIKSQSNLLLPFGFLGGFMGVQ